MLLMAKLHRLIDRQSVIFPVYRIPCQPNYLTSTQTRFQNQSVLCIIVRVFRDFQERFLFTDRQKMNLVYRFYRTIKTNTIHRMFFNQSVFLCSLEHGTQCDICLTNGRTRISPGHTVENSLTMHRLYFC